MAAGKRSLIVGWFTLFLMGTDLFVVSPLLPFISEAYGVSAATTGWMVSVFAITYAVSAPIFGWLSDQRGRRGIITFGLILFAFSNAITAWAPTFAILILSRILAGLAVSSITPLIHATIGDIAPPNKRGTWLSITISGHLTSLWTGAPFGALLEQLFDWRAVFIVMAMIGLVLAGVNFGTWGKVQLPMHVKMSVGCSIPKIISSVIVTAIWAISMYSLYVYLGAALYSVLDFTVSKIAWAVTFFGIGAVTGSLTSGRLTDRLGEKRISELTMILLSMVLFAIGVFFKGSSFVYPLLFLWGMVGYAGFASYQARLALEFPGKRGMVMAWNNTALYGGITLGSMLGGWIITEWGYGVLPYAAAVIALLGYFVILKKGMC